MKVPKFLTGLWIKFGLIFLIGPLAVTGAYLQWASRALAHDINAAQESGIHVALRSELPSWPEVQVVGSVLPWLALLAMTFATVRVMNASSTSRPIAVGLKVLLGALWGVLFFF